MRNIVPSVIIIACGITAIGIGIVQHELQSVQFVHLASIFVGVGILMLLVGFAFLFIVKE